MPWPFRREKVEGGPPVEGPPAVDRAASRDRWDDAPNRWPVAADPPEDWADPGEAAKYRWLMAERVDATRIDRGRRRSGRSPGPAVPERDPEEAAGGPSAGFDDSARVFPRIGATRRDLVALGRALVAWRDRHGAGAVSIEGLEPLLEGRYPPMEWYIGCINAHTSHAPGWEICPACVAARSRSLPGGDLIACLEDELPEDLWSSIAGFMPD